MGWMTKLAAGLAVNALLSGCAAGATAPATAPGEPGGEVTVGRLLSIDEVTLMEGDVATISYSLAIAPRDKPGKVVRVIGGRDDCPLIGRSYRVEYEPRRLAFGLSKKADEALMSEFVVLDCKMIGD